MNIDRDHVVNRLRDARDWALYIHDALSRDDSYEAGKQALLEGMAEPSDLRTLQEESRSLAARLDALLGTVTESEVRFR